MPDYFEFILIIFGAMFVLMIGAGFLGSLRRKEQKSTVEQIELGMSEEEMLSIMGGNPNRSLLKNNRVKYEWRYSNGSSTGYSHKGYSTRQYHGVRKVTIYCKDGYVEEVKPYNL